MAVFAWRRRTTRHFGDHWVPFAELHLKASNGRWRTFAVQVDSGAVVSVLARSAGDLLGVDLEAADSIELAGVGQSPRPYCVQRFPARIGDSAEFGLRVALAHREDTPNLLGRLDVLDRFQIDLDVSLEETRFTAPWLNAEGRQIWRHLLKVEATILSKWSDHPLPGQVDEAARRFLNKADQLLAAAAGLLKNGQGYELPLIIRSLFELSVQFEYLMADPEPRAAMYLDFERVTKYHLEQSFLRLPGIIGRTLRKSPSRAEGERRNREAYEKVRVQFAVKHGSTRDRPHWYPGTLRQLAGASGREAEYDAIYRLYSAWAHGDPWTAGQLELGHGGLWHPFVYWARLLTQVADAKKIILAGDAYETLQELAKGFT